MDDAEKLRRVISIVRGYSPRHQEIDVMHGPAKEIERQAPSVRFAPFMLGRQQQAMSSARSIRRSLAALTQEA